MKAYRYPFIAITTSMNKTVFNFRLKKINTTSAFMSSWRSGYFLPWMTVYKWHDLNDWRQMTCVLYPGNVEYKNGHVLTWQNGWICVNSESGLIFVWKKRRGERLLLWTNMYTNERMNTIRLLIFFQTIIKTDPKITHDSTETMTVQNRSVTGHVIRYTLR